jgi:hypothetical protein
LLTDARAFVERNAIGEVPRNASALPTYASTAAAPSAALLWLTIRGFCPRTCLYILSFFFSFFFTYSYFSPPKINPSH